MHAHAHKQPRTDCCKQLEKELEIMIHGLLDQIQPGVPASQPFDPVRPSFCAALAGQMMRKTRQKLTSFSKAHSASRRADQVTFAIGRRSISEMQHIDHLWTRFATETRCMSQLDC